MSAAGPSGPPRRLVVLRHAKSAYPDGVPDHDRPLAPRGRRDAPAAGRHLAGAGLLPDLALCSTARRARQTWQLASGQWAAAPPVSLDARLYGADVPELLDAVRDVPERVTTLLLVGHNPGLEELILTLAGDGADDALERVRTKYPTSAVAVLAWHGASWRALLPGAARLTDLAVPRGGTA
ncbi:SixA phosphatase family protein [Streptomyces sp. NPDC048566]|uniref:SixA phosphatase family protein n=1 Tax=Streptomyces sp. NPDC048566 TaxID=3365569 RepID=UPI003722588F